MATIDAYVPLDMLTQLNFSSMRYADNYYWETSWSTRLTT